MSLFQNIENRAFFPFKDFKRFKRFIRETLGLFFCYSYEKSIIFFRLKMDNSVTEFIEEAICAKCFGSGMEVLPEKGARRCECRKLKNFSNLLAQSRIPARYQDCHFQNFKSQNDSQRRALRFAASLATSYPSVKSGLLLVGTCGIGKTHLAVAILKSLAERGFSGLFYDFNVLLKEIRDSYNPNTLSSEGEILRRVFEAEILVLDELGASKPTDWVLDTVGQIINTRYSDKKLTIFTTNYLDERNNERTERLEDRIGVHIRSRIFEMCRTVQLHGVDYRRKIQGEQ
jgi:DNA replication protein DnaC